MVEAVKRGFPQREIADAAFRYQSELEDDTRIMVGVNRHTESGGDDPPIHSVDATLEGKQVERLQAARARRDDAAAQHALAALREGATGTGNLMPALLECARARATEGEMVQALQAVWGTYTEVPVF